MAYFLAISNLLYPKAFNVPISRLFSSTIRVIVVKVINAAIKKKKTGKTFAMAAMRSARSPNS